MSGITTDFLEKVTSVLSEFSESTMKFRNARDRVKDYICRKVPINGAETDQFIDDVTMLADMMWQNDMANTCHELYEVINNEVGISDDSFLETITEVVCKFGSEVYKANKSLADNEEYLNKYIGLLISNTAYELICNYAMKGGK